jgi:hypothetical protein
MLESSTVSSFDYQIVCHAEIDLPAWLLALTGKSGWRLSREEEAEMCDVYSFECGDKDAQIVLYHTGYATVEVDGHTLYDGHLMAAPGYARLQYFNAESGEPVRLN